MRLREPRLVARALGKVRLQPSDEALESVERLTLSDPGRSGDGRGQAVAHAAARQNIANPAGPTLSRNHMGFSCEKPIFENSTLCST